MKRTILRGIWGTAKTVRRNAKAKILLEVPNIIHNEYTLPFTCYAYGKDNKKFIEDNGGTAILLNDDPMPFPPEEQFRNKLEMIRYAMEEDHYDEILWIDWDCYPTKALPENFWSVLGKKESIQACLMIYMRKKAMWRKWCKRTIPNGGFLYIRDKKIPSKIIELWNTNRQDNDEPAIAMYMDTFIGNWEDREASLSKYWQLFEPDFCNLIRAYAYPTELINTKNVCFIHSQG